MAEEAAEEEQGGLEELALPSEEAARLGRAPEEE